MPQVWRFPSPAGFFDGISASTVRTAALPCAQTAENLARIRAAAEGEARNYSLADGTITTMRTQRVQRNLRRSRP